MGNEVVGEHRQPGQVIELGDRRSVQVGRRDLSAFEKRDLELVVAGAVGEARPRREPLGERDGRAAGGVGDGGERAPVLGHNEFAELHQRAGVEHHQLVVGGLAEYARHGGGIELGQLRGAPWPLSIRAVL